jgi:hypothetical protein
VPDARIWLLSMRVPLHPLSDTEHWVAPHEYGPSPYPSQQTAILHPMTPSMSTIYCDIAATAAELFLVETRFWCLRIEALTDPVRGGASACQSGVLVQI